MRAISTTHRLIIENTASPSTAMLLNPRLMGRYLQSLETHPVDTGRRKLACHILDAKCEPGGRGAVLYQFGEQLLIGEWQPNAQPEASAPTAHTLPADMQIYPYEQDPALPALPALLDRVQMTALLSRTLPECVSGGARLLHCRVTLLRYRLGKRCTLRFDLRLRDLTTGAFTLRTLYGKLYHSADKAQAVYTEMQLLAATPTLYQAGVEMAQAVAFIPELPLVLQAPVAGRPLDLLLIPPQYPVGAPSPQVCDQIRQAGAALAALHTVEVKSLRLRPVAPELARFVRRSAEVMAFRPTLGDQLHKLAQALPAWLDSLPAWGAEICLGHGDCKPSQFFVNASQVAILDFDHCGMADPAADVGNFLATLRQQGVKQALKVRDPITLAAQQQWLRELEDAFLAAYRAGRPCHPDFPQRAAWYQAVALLRKALRSCTRSSYSPLPALLVEEAWRCLEGK